MAQKRTWNSQVTSLTKGTVIQGKWHQHRYVILGKLGEGAIGTVYLCQNRQGIAALKISDKQTSITMEANVLKSIKQDRGIRLGPALLDVDDWVSPSGALYAFYVMEYVKGERLDAFIKKYGPSAIGLLLEQLTQDLEGLHSAGWVFGDLKLENVIVHPSPLQVRWVDVGGTTRIGRAIKEYTELYDRGYWGFGSRKAEPSYDLFALAMIFILIYRPQLKRPKTHHPKFLLKELDRIKPLKSYASVLKNALRGKYTQASEMNRDIKQLSRPPKTSRKNSRKNDIYLAKEAGWLFGVSAIYFILSFLVI